MNFLTPTFAFLSAVAIIMALHIYRLDSRSRLNRILAGSCLLGSLYELCLSILTAAPNAQFFWPSFVVSSTAFLLTAPMNTAASIEFAAIPKRWRLFLLVPVALTCAVQLFQVWTGAWVISGFKQTPYGNVYQVTDAKVPLLFNHIAGYVNGSIVFGVLLYAWFHSQSKRYRHITLAIIGISVLLSLWCFFATSYLWLALGFPDSTGLGVGIVLLGYSILMVRYQHLTERNPDLTEPLLASLSGTALFVDAKGIIAKAPERAMRLLGQGIEGRLFLDILQGWPDLAGVWARILETNEPCTDLPGDIGSARFRMHLLPHNNPFDQFDGVLVRIMPEGQLEASGVYYGLSSREQEVARLVCKGMDTKEIADTLFISPSTVKNHLHNLYTKTETSGRADLVLALLSNEAV